MGYYIQGPARGKADFLINMHGAEEVTEDEAAQHMQAPIESGVVCVVDNGPFDAALFCFNEREFEDASDPRDSRPKRWLVLPRWKAEQLSGYKKPEDPDAA